MLKTSVLVSFLSLLAFFDGVAGQQTFDDHFRGKGRQSQASTASQAVAQTQTSVASAAATGAAKAANNGANGNSNNNNGATGLSAQVIQSASESNGNPTNGQSASLTDNQNFVNFCQGKTLTNGQQITAGSCNGIVMGDIPSKDNMISAIILEPSFNVPIAANQDFNVRVQTNNLVAGVFTNPDNTYYAAPQQLQGGKVVGHCHVVIQKMQTFNDQSPPSASTFAFFKGIDDDGNGQGLLQATVTGGLPAGIYRVCTMMGSSNHQPPLMPVAQRGAQEDCTKFQIGGNTNNGNGNANNGNANNGNTGNANTGNANTGNGNTGNANTGAAAAASTTAQGANGNGNAQATTPAAAAATTPSGRKNRPQASTMANENGNGNGNTQGGANSAQGAAATNSVSNAQPTNSNNGRGRGQMLARSPYLVNPDLPPPRFIARNLIV